MEYQKITFPEAIKTLADRYNIPVQFEEGDSGSELYSSIYELHTIAVKLFQDNLFSQRGKSALTYLTDRGLTEDILKQFKVGFAMDSWDQLVKQCKVHSIVSVQGSCFQFTILRENPLHLVEGFLKWMILQNI